MNSSDTGSRSLLNLVQDNSSASGTTVLRVQSDGTGDIVNFFDGGTEVFTIIDGGNVGIGTTTPTTQSSVNTFLEIKSAGNRAGLALNGFGGGGGSRWEIVADEGDDLFFARAGGQKMIMTAQGNVGIGTTAPAELLSVVSSAGPTRGMLEIKNTGNNNAFIVCDANITGAGSGMGGVRQYWNGTEITRMATHSGADTTNKDDGELAFYTRTSGAALGQRMTIDSSGKVGIGTTAPSDIKMLEIQDPTTRNVATIGDAPGMKLTSRLDTVGERLEINFESYSSQTYGTASIGIVHDSVSSYETSALFFATKSGTGGSDRPIERLRIRSDGAVHLKGNTAKLYTYPDNDSSYLDYVNWSTNSGSTMTITNAGTGGLKLHASHADNSSFLYIGGTSKGRMEVRTGLVTTAGSLTQDFNIADNIRIIDCFAMVALSSGNWHSGKHAYLAADMNGTGLSGHETFSQGWVGQSGVAPTFTKSDQDTFRVYFAAGQGTNYDHSWYIRCIFA